MIENVVIIRIIENWHMMKPLCNDLKRVALYLVILFENKHLNAINSEF